MTYDIILRQENQRYLAQVREYPQVTAEASNRYLALQRIRDGLKEYLSNHVEIVQIDLDLPEVPVNPWVEQFGRFKDDPDFDEYLAEIQSYRQELDAEVLFE
jgi:hypothetical protein